MTIVHKGTEPEGIAIADKLGVSYDGFQFGIGMEFTDILQTGSTFYGNTLEVATRNLANMRAKFSEAGANSAEESQ